MIKVIEGYELRPGADIQPLFVKLRSYAMTFPGFISAEHIRSLRGVPVSALLYNWEKLENWELWESSKVRQRMLEEADRFAVSPPRVTVYEVVATSGWAYTKLE